MGKSSRNKAERRQERDREATIAAATRRPERRIPVFWIAIGLAVALGLVAIVVTGRDDAKPDAAPDAPAFGDVTVTGDPLPTFENEGDDPAVGERAPLLTGTGIDNEPVKIAPQEGGYVLVAMAHWCPHCRKEIPLIVAAQGEGELPSEVQVFGLATATSESQPNFPPAEWLADENWTYPTMVDDEAGTAAEAIGLEGYPFFLFVNGDGTVADRASGELEMGDLAERMRKLEPVIAN